ncbi:hypothetical protein Q5752_002741 [Cryptotrichosporon argae]
MPHRPRQTDEDDAEPRLLIPALATATPASTTSGHAMDDTESACDGRDGGREQGADKGKGVSANASTGTGGKDAVQVVDAAVFTYTADEERRVLRKIDLTLLPLTMAAYTLQYVDRSATSYAAVFTFRADLHLSPDQYAWLGSCYFLGYLAFEFPGSYLLQRLPLSKLLGSLVVLWGALLLLSALPRTFAPFAALRTLLGASEALVTPGLVLLFARFYTRAEQPARVGAWYACNGLGNLAGALVSLAMGRVHVGNVPGWAWIFIFNGAISVVYGAVFLALFPESPQTFRWLTPRERRIAVARVRANRSATSGHRVRWDQVAEALLPWRDPQGWAYFAIVLCLTIPNGGIANFLHLILQSYGYSAFQTVLIGLPGAAMQIVFPLTGMLVARRWTGWRCRTMMLYMLPCLVGSILQFTTRHKPALLFGYYILTSYVTALALCFAAPGANVAGHSKRITVGAMIFIAYAAGNIAGPHLFIATEDPPYRSGMLACIVCFATVIPMAAALRWCSVPFLPYYQHIAPAPPTPGPGLPTPTTGHATPSSSSAHAQTQAGTGAGAGAYRVVQPASYASPGSDEGPARRKLRVVERGREACNECRHHKIRCHPAPDDPEHVHPCARCKRMSLECVFKKHNRGRKRKHPLPDDAEGDSHAPSSHSAQLSPASLAGISPAERKPLSLSARSSPSSALAPAPASPETPSHAFTLSVSRYPFIAPTSAVSAARPRPPHLNTRTMSLRTMLESDHSSDADDDRADDDRADVDVDAAWPAELPMPAPHGLDLSRAGVVAPAGGGPDPDPVSAGLVDAAEAGALFDLFLRHFNPNMPLLDPAVHTHDAVRADCTLLYTAVLSVTSRYLARLDLSRRRTQAQAADAHRQIRVMANTHLASAYAAAASSVHVVQAMVVLSLWKEPDDDKAGYHFNRAVILAREQQIGRVYSHDELARMPGREKREVRMRQRLWMSLFATNSIFHMQFRQPMLISFRDPLIAKSDHWLRHADPDMRLSDTFVCLSVDLRKRYLHYRELLKPSEDVDTPPPSALSLSVLTKSMNEEWDMTMESWIREIIDAGAAPGFINKPRVWTSSLRLNLNLLIVHQTLRIPAAERLDPAPPGASALHLTTLPAFHHCLNAATSVLMRMQTLDKDHLTYATDTLLHFSLYAATFLWTLCAAPETANFTEPEVDHCRALIVGTAERLEDASAYPVSSAALHAQRLRRLVRDRPDAGYRPPPVEPKYEALDAHAHAFPLPAAHMAALDPAAVAHSQPHPHAPAHAHGYAHAHIHTHSHTHAHTLGTPGGPPPQAVATDLDLLLGDFPWSGLKTPWTGADADADAAGSLFTHFQHQAPVAVYDPAFVAGMVGHPGLLADSAGAIGMLAYAQPHLM